MGVNGMYGLYGVNGTPVFGVPRARASTRRSRTVVWMPGLARGEAKLRRGRDAVCEVRGLGGGWRGEGWDVDVGGGPRPRRWGAGRGRGCTLSNASSVYCSGEVGEFVCVGGEGGTPGFA